MSLDEFVRTFDLGAFNSIETSRKVFGIGLTSFYAEVKRGRITLVRSGARSFVTAVELFRYYQERAAAPAKVGKAPQSTEAA